MVKEEVENIAVSLDWYLGDLEKRVGVTIGRMTGTMNELRHRIAGALTEAKTHQATGGNPRGIVDRILDVLRGRGKV